MSDFDDRLRAALEGGAELAPGTAGLADAARRRQQARRRRTVAGTAAAVVVAVAVPTAVIAGGGGVGRPDPVAPSPGPEWAEEIQVTCVEGHRWPVSAMDGGAGGEVDEGEVRAAFADLLQEASMDAPEAIREQGFEDVPYVLLSGDDDEAVVGVGPWSIDGPGSGADYVVLERRNADLRPRTWGDCELSVALPEDQWQVEITAPKGGVDPSGTEITVLVNEVECTSSRDPRPYLGEPEVTERDDRVLVSMSSEVMRGGVDCAGNPRVPVTIRLDRPLGGRELYDAGTWPPTPVAVADPAALGGVGWQTRTHEGVRFEVPAHWSGAFRGRLLTYRPDSFARPLTTGLSLLGRASFEPAFEQGTVRRSEDRGAPLWTGYRYAGAHWVVLVATRDEAMTRRILDSVRSGADDSGPADGLPCDPGMGFPEPRRGCPDPEPTTGWLTSDGGRVWFQPFRLLGNDDVDRAYARRHGLEHPFPGDFYDMPIGSPRLFELDRVSLCSGVIRVGYREPLGDHVVRCDAFRRALQDQPEAAIPVAVWSGSGVDVLQMSELYRP